MDEQSCEMTRAWWLVYRNPNKHADRLRFVGAFDTAAGAEMARAKAQAERPAIKYAVVQRPAMEQVQKVMNGEMTIAELGVA